MAFTLLTQIGPGFVAEAVPVQTGVPRLQFEIVTPLTGRTVGVGAGPL